MFSLSWQFLFFLYNIVDVNIILSFYTVKYDFYIMVLDCGLNSITLCYLVY